MRTWKFRIDDAELRATVLKLLNDGLTHSQIAERTGMSKPRVSEFAASLGWKSKRGRRPVSKPLVEPKIEPKPVLVESKPKPAPKRGPRARPDNYLRNSRLLEELRLRHERGEPTPNLARAFMLLVQRYSQKWNWRGYSYNDEFQSEALLHRKRCARTLIEFERLSHFQYHTIR